MAPHFPDKTRLATLVGVLFLTAVSACPQSSTQHAPGPLSSGIARNQQELQELSKIISENNREMKKIVGDAIVSLMAAVAGAGPSSEFGQSPKESVANLLSALQKLQGALDTSKDALDGDAWLAISGQLKLVLDLIGEEELPVRFANTLTDLLVKTTQLVSLARQNARLVQAEVQIAKAQTYLQAKAASIEMRRTAAQSSLLPQITDLNNLQSKWLLQQYKDKPQAIELAVKTAAARSNFMASEVARGIIVDPQADVDTLARMPGINPDFIKSLRRQFELLERGDVASVYAAAGLDKYSDHTYINIFGPSRESGSQGKPLVDSNSVAVSGKVKPRAASNAMASATSGSDSNELAGRWVLNPGGPDCRLGPDGAPVTFPACNDFQSLELRQISDGQYSVTNFFGPINESPNWSMVRRSAPHLYKADRRLPFSDFEGTWNCASRETVTFEVLRGRIRATWTVTELRTSGPPDKQGNTVEAVCGSSGEESGDKVGETYVKELPLPPPG